MHLRAEIKQHRSVKLSNKTSDDIKSILNNEEKPHAYNAYKESINRLRNGILENFKKKYLIEK